MANQRLVSLLHRLRYAYSLNKHVPLRKEIIAFEHAICALQGHTMQKGVCVICSQSAVVIRGKQCGMIVAVKSTTT